MPTLNEQVKELQERAHKLDLAAAQARIERAEHDARRAEDIMAKAIAEANGEDAAHALRVRDEALDQIREAAAERDALKAEKPKPSFLAPLSALKFDNLLNFIPMPAIRPPTFADTYSVTDLLDERGVAQYLAACWLDGNKWFATASPLQRKIIDSLHITLRAQNLAVNEPEYWVGLSGFVVHLKLDTLTIAAEEKPVTVQEKILRIMEGLVDTIAAAKADDDAPLRKKPLRVRKKPKNVAPTPPEVRVA